MAVLVCLNPLPSLTLPHSSSLSISSTVAITNSPVFRLHFDVRSKSSSRARNFLSFIASKRGAVIVKASSDIDITATPEGGNPSFSSNEEVVSVDKLPLESKEQERLEQKLRMKLAKKIRLRRKRLVRKRRMRKKGRWPPSKMKKLKNV
ncbi:50S ribosomal protein 5, chloroplastic [Mangifera indica]|uniref:50S ribosomal protein 5, chloroplastic n=1 Tax=Mangifera indica TaxID=29780 RepID=UPI001CF9D28A|nr:50S ribosomal protein 5, chloroplastic [Mangifera indica]